MTDRNWFWFTCALQRRKMIASTFGGVQRLTSCFFGHYINAHTVPSDLFVRNFLSSQLPSSTVVCCVCGWLRIRRQLVSGVVVAGNKKKPKKQHPEPENFSSFPPNGCSLPVNHTGFVSMPMRLMGNAVGVKADLNFSGCDALLHIKLF